MASNILIHLSDKILQAYVDGELPPEQRRTLAAKLRHRPEVTARAAELRGQSQALHDTYDHHLHEPLPKATRRLAGRLSRRCRRRGSLTSRRLALAACVALAAGTLGLAAVRDTGLNPMAEEIAFGSHGGGGNAGMLKLTADVRPSGTAPDRGPDLTAYGYQLVDAQWPQRSGDWATMIYRDADGAALTLYVAKGARDASRISYAWEGSSTALFWQDADAFFGLVGRLSRAQMLDISRAVVAGQTRPSSQSTPSEKTSVTGSSNTDT